MALKKNTYVNGAGGTYARVRNKGTVWCAQLKSGSDTNTHIPQRCWSINFNGPPSPT